MASKKTEIPKHELQALARAFADDIVAFFESEEGQREYEEWVKQKEKNKTKAVRIDIILTSFIMYTSKFSGATFKSSPFI